MKAILSIALTLVLTAGLLTGCGCTNQDMEVTTPTILPTTQATLATTAPTTHATTETTTYPTLDTTEPDTTLFETTEETMNTDAARRIK